jgi:hypothetical protein
MRAANVDPVQMRDPSVSLRDVDILELDVHVVLRYAALLAQSCRLRPQGHDSSPTFYELSAVCLARIDLDGDLMTLCLMASAVTIL